MKAKIGIAAAVVAAVAVSAIYVFGNRLSVYSSEFKSYEDAVKAGAIGASLWIPPFIHLSAKAISEAHDIDTNEVRLSYSFSPATPGLIALECQDVSREAVVWPDASRLKKFAAEEVYQAFKRSGNRYVACSHSGLRYFFAVDTDASKVYAWALR